MQKNDSITVMFHIPLLWSLLASFLGLDSHAFAPSRPNVRGVARPAFSALVIYRPYKSEHHKSEHSRQATATERKLFFRSDEEREEIARKSSPRRDRIPRRVLEDLESPNLALPYQFSLKNTITVRGSTQSLFPSRTVTVRPLEVRDIPAVTDYIVEEYGGYEVTFPWEQQQSPPRRPRSLWYTLRQWFARETLRPVVDITMFLKINPLPQDHAVLLATVRTSGSDDSDDDDCSEEIVGMVEVSRQPPIPERNPPVYPIPLLFKELLLFPNQELVGWITNLLVTPRHRRSGYAVVLMKAAEGLASQWKCRSMNLHVHADVASGYGAQQLYRSKLGYETLEERSRGSKSRGSDAYDDLVPPWLEGPSTAVGSSVYIIEGAPLMYLKKDLRSKEKSKSPPATTDTQQQQLERTALVGPS